MTYGSCHNSVSSYPIEPSLKYAVDPRESLNMTYGCCYNSVSSYPIKMSSKYVLGLRRSFQTSSDGSCNSCSCQAIEPSFLYVIVLLKGFQTGSDRSHNFFGFFKQSSHRLYTLQSFRIASKPAPMVATNPSVASNPAMLCRLAYRGRFGKGDGEWAYRRTFGEGDRGDWQRLARSKTKEVGIVAYTT
jgi:hypothetical protein